MSVTTEWNTEVYKSLHSFYSKWNFGAGFYQVLYVCLSILAIVAPLAVVAFSTTSTPSTTQAIIPPKQATPSTTPPTQAMPTSSAVDNKIILAHPNSIQMNFSSINWMRFFAFAGAVSIGLINSINFEEKAQNFRNASDHLYLGLIRRQTNEFDENQLVESFHEAQELIGTWKFKPPKNTDKS